MLNPYIKLFQTKIRDLDRLEHSGVKGMKWGVRNGPPYPVQLYRYAFGGQGIYEFFRKNVDAKTWKKFLRSPAASWLPKPEESVYDPRKFRRYESYFTKAGKKKFDKLTLPLIKQYVTKIDEETTSASDIRNREIVYQDRYQIVYGVRD